MFALALVLYEISCAVVVVSPSDLTPHLMRVVSWKDCHFLRGFCLGLLLFGVKSMLRRLESCGSFGRRLRGIMMSAWNVVDVLFFVRNVYVNAALF